MPGAVTSALRRLEGLRLDFGADAAEEKLGHLRLLERGTLGSASLVRRLHEMLLFMRAHPDDAAVHRAAVRLLGAFDRRSDLRRHRRELADSGIAGTDIHYPFFAETASWLARRHGGSLRIDWREFARMERLERYLPLLVHYAETPAIDDAPLAIREWIERLKGSEETDAAFVIRRYDAVWRRPRVRETLFEDLNMPIVLEAGARTPSRTRECHRASTVTFMDGPLDRSRPPLPEAVSREPGAVREAGTAEARELIDLARGMMVVRGRDLDAFAYGDPGDVRVIDWERGLQFVFIGMLPERRLMFECQYGYVTLRNGVPLGYGTACALFGSAEIANNIFDTFRGGESALILARLLATVRHLLGPVTFTLDPYQLGKDNSEAIRSGAWWFYRKMGFGPRDPAAIRLMRAEEAKLRTSARLRSGPRMRSGTPGRRPGAAYRTPPATLRTLAESNLFLDLGRRRRDVLGVIDLSEASLRVSALLARRFGSDRERGARVCEREAAALLGVRVPRGTTAGERLAWRRWAPLVLALPGVPDWTADDRKALADIARAKGGRRESDFLRLFDRHARLREAILRLSRNG